MNQRKKATQIIQYLIIVGLLINMLCSSALAVAPQETGNFYSPGQNGYAGLSKYATLVDEEEGIYRITLGIDFFIEPTQANIVLLINQNGTMTYPTSNPTKIRYDLLAEALSSMFDLFYTDDATKDHVNFNFQGYALSYDEYTTSPAYSPSNLYEFSAYAPPHLASNPTLIWGNSNNKALSKVVIDRTATPTSRESTDLNHPNNFMGVDHYTTIADPLSFQKLLAKPSVLQGMDKTNSVPQFAFKKARDVFSQPLLSKNNVLKYVIFFTDGWNQSAASFSSADFYASPALSSNPTDSNNITKIENPNFDYDNLLFERFPEASFPFPAYWFSNAVDIPLTNNLDTTSYSLRTVPGYPAQSGWVVNSSSAQGVDPISLKATIWEAEQLKKDGVKVYSIGLNDAASPSEARFSPNDANNLAVQMIEQTATNPSMSYVLDMSDSDVQASVNALLQNIATDIKNTMLKGATVHDKVTDYFDIITYQDFPMFTTSNGEAVVENGEIVWNLTHDGLLSDDAQYLTYYVQAKSPTDETLWYPTNEYAYLDWIDPNTNTQNIKYFPMPYVNKADIKNSEDEGIVLNNNTGLPINFILDAPLPTYTPSASSIVDEKVDDATIEMPITGEVKPFVIILLIALSSAGIVIIWKQKKKN